MANVSYLVEKRRQKMYIKAYAVLCLALILSLGLYSYKKWQQYTGYRAIVETQKTFITELRDELSDEKAYYEGNKDGFDSLSEEIGANLALIFPAEDDYTALTRQIDDFEKELSKKTNPFEISSIDYQTSLENEFYSILPMRMSIRSSNENFRKFLHLVENSGSLLDQVRLMDISSIRLNFLSSDEDTVGPEIINFTVQINAYFQKTSG